MRASKAWPSSAIWFCAFGSFFAGGDPQLPFDEVDAGHHLAHRVLDLQAGVHLHEPETVSPQPVRRIDDEFDGASAGIFDGLGGLHGRSVIAARISRVMPGAGASSITFWWRR